MTEELQLALEPLLESIEHVNKQIKAFDKQIDAMAEKDSNAKRLMAINGVGALTVLAYMLTLEDPKRFAHGRDVGAFIGLVPRQSQSGDNDPQLRITRAGDGFVRRLLIQCAQHILGPHGRDTDLRRFGQRLAARGGNNAKKKAVVAVARKLAVLMHHLWDNGVVYEPLRNSEPTAQAA